MQVVAVLYCCTKISNREIGVRRDEGGKEFRQYFLPSCFFIHSIQAWKKPYLRINLKELLVTEKHQQSTSALLLFPPSPK